MGSEPSAKASRTEWAAACVIVGVAAWLRLRNLGDASFGSDAAHMIQLADRMRAGERILAGIPSSKGVLNPPLSIYVVFVLRVMLRSARAMTAGTAVLNVAAVAATWPIVRRWFGPRVALTATALFAVSGWAVLYGRTLWQQDFLPPLGVASLGALLTWAADGKRWGLGLALALAGAASQLHMTGFAWFGVIATVWIALRPPVSKASVAVGLAVCATLYVPFAVGAATSGLGGHGGPQALLVDFLGTPVKHALGSITHGGITFAVPTMHASFTRIGGTIGVLHPIFDVVPWIGAGLAVAGAVAAKPRRIARNGRVEGDPASAVLLSWIAVPLLAMVGTGLSTAPHYVILLFPGMWILAAIGADALPRLRVPRIAADGLVAALVAGELAFVLALQWWIARDFVRPGGYGVPLRFQEQAVEFAARDAGTAPAALVPVPDPAASGAPRSVDANYEWLLVEARAGRPAAGAPRRYVLLDLSEGELSPAAQAAIEARRAERFGPLWVVPWP